MKPEDLFKQLTEDGVEGVPLENMDPRAMAVVFASHSLARMLHSPAVLAYAHFDNAEPSDEPDGLVSFALHPDFKDIPGFTTALRNLADKLDAQQSTIETHGEMARQMRDAAKAADPDTTKH